jgi:DNA-binding PadR family transcriptional regulator
VYPILIRLAERRQVDTEWERDAPSGRPARHLYRLSAEGAKLVAELSRADVSGRRTAFGRSTPASATE